MPNKGFMGFRALPSALNFVSVIIDAHRNPLQGIAVTVGSNVEKNINMMKILSIIMIMFLFNKIYSNDYNGHSIAKVSTVDTIVTTATPRLIYFGYFGLIKDYSIGACLKYISQNERFSTYLNYAFKNNDNSFLDFEINPVAYYGEGYRLYVNPYIKGIINNKDNIIHYNGILCNNMYLLNNIFNVGLGIDKFSNKSFTYNYLAGYKRYIHFFHPFFSSYFDCDFIFNQSNFGLMSHLDLIYTNNLKYKTFIIEIGYQSLYRQNNIVLSFKYRIK